MNMPVVEEVWRTGALYTISEAAKLVGVAPITIKRWLYGYESERKLRYPVFGHPTEDVSAPLISFLVLAELLVYQSFRKRRLKPEVIEAAYKRAKMSLGVDYPFAAMRLESLGGHVLFDDETEGPHASLDQPGAKAMLPGAVIDTLNSFDYEGDLASRWHPKGRTVPIVVDPRFAAGLPAIENRGITIEHIKARFDANQSITFISRDLDITRLQVEEALRYADKLAA
jgi:uncharacterized protein (DUF433 family)